MKRGAVIGIVVGAAVVVAGAGVAWWALSRVPSAEAAAEAYLDALVAGDYAAIAGMRDSSLGDADEAIIETAFTSATAYVTDPTIDELTRVTSGVGVRAHVALDGERHDLFFMLSDASGAWRLAGDYLASIEASPFLDTDPDAAAGAAGDSVWIGDALAPAWTPVSLLPAVYEVSAAPRALLEGSTSVPLSNDESQRVEFAVSVSPAAVETAQTQLDAYAEQCAAATDAVPDHCGLRVPWAADLAALDEIAFRIEQAPLLALAPDARSFDATGGVIVATATGTGRDGASRTFTYRADDWALRGSVSFHGDEMVLSVR